jgi:4-aminobutyrate aminotransferase / (S)-3-amino-2-methylpropionate transaminase / 5-aminovalerate transaminase
MLVTTEGATLWGHRVAGSAGDGADDSWVIETLRRYEPAALHTQVPVVWHRASGSRVFDSRGRSWLDWTSSTLTANAGHAPAEVVNATLAQVGQGLLHAWAFPTRIRARLVRAIAELTGFPQCVLFTTGAEAIEGALKISRWHALDRGRHRALVVTFEGAFHGRTLGAQLASGQPAQRYWGADCGAAFIQVPYPVRGQKWSPAVIEAALREVGAGPEDVACVLGELYQGSTLRVLDASAARALRKWCTGHEIPLVFDEIQSGFGRTGALFAYERTGARPDLLVCGKGLSGSLPVSAVLVGDPRYTDDLPPGSITSTHGGSPLAMAAAEANIALFADGTLVAAAARRGEQLADGLARWAARLPERCRVVGAVGMVAGVVLTNANGVADPRLGRQLVAECADRGLLLCAPAALEGTLVKIHPPLTVTEADLTEGLSRFAAATNAVQPG